MTAPCAESPLAIPERMWFADTRMGGFVTTERAPGDNSAFAHWRAAGRLLLSPWSGRLDEYDATLAKMMPGDPVFAYEGSAGVVAIGRVCDPKDLTVSVGATVLYPRAGSIVKSLAVDWDTTVTCTTADVWGFTNLGGPALKSCGPETKFFPKAVAMLREAHERHQADPDACEAATLKRIGASLAYDSTTRAQVIQARVGQGRFRKAVLAREPACRLTGITDPGCLVASHIKPWAHCAGGEYVDDANGLMLAPHTDHLFDTGLISFTDDGLLLLAPALDRQILRAWHIDEQTNVGPFAPDQTRYLKYHREHVFGRARIRHRRNLVGDAPVSVLDGESAAPGASTIGNE
jgi:hypothetical protein